MYSFICFRCMKTKSKKCLQIGVNLQGLLMEIPRFIDASGYLRQP